ncbi:polyphosphate kinase 1 [Chryseolinea lacunae]|uniref:Polyphosphate kinase n=1 Tax=Chryseolinea lacunae TaxID=2801331 RepID=A0ABS1KXW1_9BACT|nr:polyphosphate kinase 1 [Chryseolinea lacunae]MBL0744128.1 polyphosphate kinase 1 [Chryseolinea lacunae]
MAPKSDTSFSYPFFDRDISWLSFNERVLLEAQRNTVPLMERIRFLAIYSSNLDEFYRVRMPALTALTGIADKAASEFKETLATIHNMVMEQQTRFGNIIGSDILQALRDNGIRLLYNEPIPDAIRHTVTDYFIHTVALFLQPVEIDKHTTFFPENNKLYLTVTTRSAKKGARVYIVNVPSDELPRFFTVRHDSVQYIVFLEDIIKLNLDQVFYETVLTCHSIKVTRDSDLNLEDEFTGNLAEKIEQRIGTRDLGFATRFLYEPDLPPHTLRSLKKHLNLGTANFIVGGAHHNLKDLSSLPLKGDAFYYEPWPVTQLPIQQSSLFAEIRKQDLLLHPPYHRYDTVLRFFAEASLDPSVKAIYVTLYRVAADSRIAQALMSAARNGKRVVVFVELKARFDEANNLKWSKKMKAAGVRIIESIPGLKVHAKIALVKRRHNNKTELLGLLATGNFNESTARFYTDHVLLTAHQKMLAEVASLFDFLKKRKKRSRKTDIAFKHLLVGHFNLQHRFLDLIDREIEHARNGKPNGIIIKLNNLEERVLVAKLYEASAAGVKIQLVVRGICCLMPGVAGLSENITVKRIIDRYLEHGRIFIFENAGTPEYFMGSADWMIRNIYRRIEVCFPIYSTTLKEEILKIVKLQLADNCQAGFVDEHGKNVACDPAGVQVRSQKAIAGLVAAGQVNVH